MTGGLLVSTCAAHTAIGNLDMSIMNSEHRSLLERVKVGSLLHVKFLDHQGGEGWLRGCEPNQSPLVTSDGILGRVVDRLGTIPHGNPTN